MAEGSSIAINIESAKTATDSIKNGNNKLNLAIEAMSSNPFSALCSINPDLGTHYITEYLKSLTEVNTFATTVHEAVNAYIDGIKKEEDEEPPKNNNTNRPNGGGSSNHGGNGGSSSSGGGNGGGNTPIVTPPVVPPPGQQINPFDTTSLSELDLKGIDSVVDTLKDMSKKKGKGIDEVLMNEKYAEELKKLLLNSPYISKELKEILQTADSQVIRKTLVAVMKGQHPEVFDLNPLNLGIVYTYLMQIANQNGITVEQLLSDPKYAEILKTTLLGFDDVVELLKGWENLSAEEYQAQLLKIYDGDQISEIKTTAVSIVRNFVDYIADATEQTAEELLTDPKYAEIMKTATQQFGKTSLFMSATASYSEEERKEVVGNLFNGKNAKALGMTDQEVAGFKNEINTLAKEKGVTSKELLSNSNYANDIKQALAQSENAKEVGTIYSKADASVSQNVAKNLYNTKITTT